MHISYENSILFNILIMLCYINIFIKLIIFLFQSESKNKNFKLN